MDPFVEQEDEPSPRNLEDSLIMEGDRDREEVLSSGNAERTAMQGYGEYEGQLSSSSRGGRLAEGREEELLSRNPGARPAEGHGEQADELAARERPMGVEEEELLSRIRVRKGDEEGVSLENPAEEEDIDDAMARLSLTDEGNGKCEPGICSGIDDEGGKLHSIPVDLPPESPSSSRSEASTGRKNEAFMDEGLWSNLPDHLLDHVLACLPFWSLLRLRSVCKKWNCILESRNFLDTCSRVPSHDILFIMFADFLRLNAAAAYNPALNKWHLIPLSLFTPSKPPNNCVILAAAGGLLCLEEIAWPNRLLLVSNPTNRSYKQLPPMLHMKCPYVVGMMMEADMKGYRILVAQDGETLVSQYYESRTDSWKMNRTLNRRVALISGTTSLEGLFFCLTFGPIGLVAYNIEEASWNEIQISMPPSIVCPHVIEYKRQLLLVGGVEEYGSLTSIRIWRLNLSRKVCTEVDRMPDHLFHRLTSAGREHFFCVAQGGLICFNHGTAPDILMYGMAEKRWWWLPPCPLHYSMKGQSEYAFKTLGFSIEPRFDVKV